MKRIDDAHGRVCTKCNQFKTADSFWKKSEARKDGSVALRPVCKECGITDKLNKYHTENGKERQKERSFRALMKKYGISPEVYEQERIKQEYSCYLCGEHEDKQPHKRLHVDHCHTTGKYRGLLCNKCNAGLGFFNDNIAVLQKAIEYINDNSTGHRNNT